ncbi:rhomboid family intramembrane serine protease [Actinomadura sp. HBU206391]|uniref:rhomboid family intramembrane serine protease n=1 Tax=Actinomadura sp. HBU206391 TaxID=2731692 RepID=UPI00165001BC|nr:rhomboid family intramembrane serine protease [Actinomadura sp. HBU206391]MBC6462213.1 rhomboid family intramembrane serine protease [Actinomadura sp. HBU206391]
MALPLYDSQPTRRAPLITYLLVAVNVVVFLITPMAGFAQTNAQARERQCAQVTFIRQYGAIPRELMSNRQEPLPEGIMAQCRPEPFDKMPWLSAFSSMFLHRDWEHLLGNMIFLFVFGQAAEDRLGRLRFTLFYLLWGLVAVYGFAVTDPDSIVPLIGASGAIAGVLGAHLVMFPRSRTIALIPPVRLPAWLLLGQFFLLQWQMLGSDDGVAYVAHIYGFVAGAAFGLWARRAPALRRAAVLGSRR